MHNCFAKIFQILIIIVDKRTGILSCFSVLWLFDISEKFSLSDQIYFLKIKDFLPKLGKSHGVNDDGHFRLVCPNLFINFQCLFNFKLDLSRFANMTYLLNILFLGLGASALCFVTWNFAVKILGAVKTSICIYLVPVITVVASVLIIHEPFT